MTTLASIFVSLNQELIIPTIAKQNMAVYLVSKLRINRLGDQITEGEFTRVPKGFKCIISTEEPFTKNNNSYFGSPEENLQFVFKYIDPKDEEKPFVFTVAITTQKKYSGNALVNT